MAGPYDCVVSIGGQSFADGVWRLLEPALEGLTNPLPIVIPGFANAQMRVTRLVPIIPGTPPSSGGLAVRASVELTAEALLHVLVESGTATIALGPQSLTLANLAGPIALPSQAGTLTNVAIGGTVGTLASNLTGGTGNLSLPGGTATLAGGTGTGMLALPSSLTLPGIPLPAVVPVTVDLTAAGPYVIDAVLQLKVDGPDAATRFGALFSIQQVLINSIGGPAAPDPIALATTLQQGLNRILAQLLSPIAAPSVDPTPFGTLLQVPLAAGTALYGALGELLAQTGRLTYPAPGAGASCDTRVLPTSADATLKVATDGSYVLQIGFRRAGSADISSFPPVTSPIECEVLVGNSFLLGLLCCLIERLPAFNLPVAATTGTVDVAGGTHIRCCNFTDVTANLGGIVIGGGGLSVCIDGASGGSKSLSLVGRFAQTIGLSIPLFGITANLGSIAITADFTLPLAFDFDDAASIANLHPIGTPSIVASVTPNMTGAAILVFILAILVPIAAVLSGLLAPLGALLGAVMASVVVLIVLMLVQVACAVATRLLRNAVRVLLSGASLLRSPIAVPPGLFEAFGRFAPAKVTIDDLKATGVLHTPTSVWGLLPRIGPPRRWFHDWKDVKIQAQLRTALAPEWMEPGDRQPTRDVGQSGPQGRAKSKDREKGSGRRGKAASPRKAEAREMTGPASRKPVDEGPHEI